MTTAFYPLVGARFSRPGSGAGRLGPLRDDRQVRPQDDRLGPRSTTRDPAPAIWSCGFAPAGLPFSAWPVLVATVLFAATIGPLVFCVTHRLRTDLARFTFLLDHDEGEQPRGTHI